MKSINEQTSCTPMYLDLENLNNIIYCLDLKQKMYYFIVILTYST